MPGLRENCWALCLRIVVFQQCSGFATRQLTFEGLNWSFVTRFSSMMQKAPRAPQGIEITINAELAYQAVASVKETTCLGAVGSASEKQLDAFQEQLPTHGAVIKMPVQ